MCRRRVLPALPRRCTDNRIRKLKLLKLNQNKEKKKKPTQQLRTVFRWLVKLTTNLTLNIRSWKWVGSYSAQNLEDVEDFEEKLTVSTKNT